MVTVKDLTETRLKDLWREVKDEDEWWGEISEEVLALVKVVLESSLEEEILEELRVDRYRRSHLRMGYRNGYYERSLVTRFGIIKSLRVPRTRDSFTSGLLRQYQRRTTEVDNLIRECFLGGVSTRRVGEVLKPILGEKLSPQAVSRVAQRLDREVRCYHNRVLWGQYQYLFLDGITLKVKSALGVKKRLVLCAYGITLTGKRELISFRQATAESAAQWEAFLRNLYERGLDGKNLSLIVTDGCPGLQQALETVYPYTPLQRCWAHKLRNIAAKLPRKIQEDCLREARSIYLADTRREAVHLCRTWTVRWRPPAPKAVACLEEDIDELLNFLDCPREHWKKVRTTNVIERAFREVRRRTRPMSCFQNSASVDRIIFGVISYLNGKWEEHPLWKFTQNT